MGRQTAESLLTIAGKINCRALAVHGRDAEGWVISCRLDGKAATEERCRLCRRKDERKVIKF